MIGSLLAFAGVVLLAVGAAAAVAHPRPALRRRRGLPKVSAEREAIDTFVARFGGGPRP